MKVIGIQENIATVQLSVGELLIINNALNEICNGIAMPEFDTRIGASLNQVLLLLRAFGEAIDDS